MEAHFNKYLILNADFSIGNNIEYEDFKYNCIANFIYNQIENKNCFLFEMMPTKHSIIYDVTSSYKEVVINTKKCLFTIDLDLNRDEIYDIIKEQEFYLGNLIIICSQVSEKTLKNIANLWNSGLYKTGLEIFKMDSDGLSFYWYNPKDSFAENTFENFVVSFNANFK